VILKFPTHRLQLAQDQQRRHVARVFPLQSHWRTCWTSRLHLQWSCHSASDRPAGCHVPDSTAPSRRCPSDTRPDRGEHWCTLATTITIKSSSSSSSSLAWPHANIALHWLQWSRASATTDEYAQCITFSAVWGLQLQGQADGTFQGHTVGPSVVYAVAVNCIAFQWLATFAMWSSRRHRSSY